jgi:hypothetical protein
MCWFYLNPNWKEEWGGKLELWDKKMTACEEKVLPVYNRCVIFNTDADYTNIKGRLGANDKVVSGILKLFSGRKKR